MPNAGEPVYLAALFEAARQAQANAYAPYSKFPVGAAVRSASGVIFAGCNVENAAYPAGVCAETSAIAAMVASGERRIAQVLVIGALERPIMPCGACRQRILEFGAPDVLVFTADARGPGPALSLGELLPHAFGPDHLARPSRVVS